MYPTIAEAVTNRIRLRLGATLAKVLAPLLLWQTQLQLGISPEKLRPIEHIPSINAPVLIISGENDHHTSSAETKRIFSASREPKALWLIKGASHVDLHAFNPQAYETKVSNFLLKHLH